MVVARVWFWPGITVEVSVTVVSVIVFVLKIRLVSSSKQITVDDVLPRNMHGGRGAPCDRHS